MKARFFCLLTTLLFTATLAFAGGGGSADGKKPLVHVTVYDVDGTRLSKKSCEVHTEWRYDSGSGEDGNVSLGRIKIVGQGAGDQVTAMTSKEGNFQFTFEDGLNKNQHSRNLLVVVAKNGIGKATFTVSYSNPNASVEVHLTHPPEDGVVYGQVVLAPAYWKFNGAIFNIVFILHKYGSSNPYEGRKFYTKTDKDGNYKISGLPAGMYSIISSAKVKSETCSINDDLSLIGTAAHVGSLHYDLGTHIM